MWDQVCPVYLEAYSKYLLAIFDTAHLGHPSELFGGKCPLAAVLDWQRFQVVTFAAHVDPLGNPPVANQYVDPYA